jgi:predicted hydrocarbon binding protein
MISITDLLADNHIPGNYFANDAYVQGDLELGLLENRRGERLLALPETLLQGIYAGLEKETGQASWMVLFNCGRWWGRNFYARFCEELSEYYKVSLSDMPMVEFIQCLQQCWITHGWGRIELDYSYHQHGFLVVTITNSPFAQEAPKGNQPACYLEAGVLSAFFSQLTGRDLHCIQTACESMGADRNRFVLGIAKRLEPAETMVTNLDHDAIMAQLCS